MAKALRILAAIVTTPFLIVVYLNIEVFASAHGWDSFLKVRFPDMVSVLTQPWVFALACGVVGFALGVFANWIATRIDRRPPSEVNQIATATGIGEPDSMLTMRRALPQAEADAISRCVIETGDLIRRTVAPLRSSAQEIGNRWRAPEMNYTRVRAIEPLLADLSEAIHAAIADLSRQRRENRRLETREFNFVFETGTTALRDLQQAAARYANAVRELVPEQPVSVLSRYNEEVANNTVTMTNWAAEAERRLSQISADPSQLHSVGPNSL